MRLKFAGSAEAKATGDAWMRALLLGTGEALYQSQG